MMLLFLLLLNCLGIYSERIPHRRHHLRRSISTTDERYLGFRFSVEPQDKVVVSGTVLLDCQYVVEKGHVDDIRIEWKKDGMLVNTKNPSTHMFANGSLTILDVASADDGLYQCTVSVTSPNKSKWVFLSRKARLIVQDLPRFDAQPVDRAVQKGYPTAFHCLVSMNPSPNVTWFLNGKQITDGGEFHVLPTSHTLEISSVQPRHVGAYQCQVEGAGKLRRSQTGQLSLTETEPAAEITILSAPREQTVSEGDAFILECLTTAKNRPQIRWLKDSRQITLDGDRIRRVGVASLFVLKSQLDDSGLYTCRAGNVDDSVDRTVVVTITSKPHITTRPEDKVAMETGDVEMECLASGRPLPSISWYKNGETIVPSEYFVLEANKLRILGLVKTDQGVYQCLAENSAGTQQAAAQLLVESAGPTYLSTVGLASIRMTTVRMPADDSSSLAASSGKPLVPSAPLGLRVTTTGSRFVSFDWDPPLHDHGTIMRYHVFYREEDSDRERMLNTSMKSITIPTLQPDTLYILKVAAENEAGMGKISDHLKMRTKKEQAVPSRVQNVRAEALGPQTIEVRWDPPSGGMTPIRYKVFYIRNPSANEPETQSTTESTSYTMHGMEKFTEYRIRVEAEGENGTGLSSDIVTVRTLSDVPANPPRDITIEAESSTSLKVTWNEPDDDGTNGEITGYKIKYKTKFRGGKGNTFVTDATDRQYTITALDPNTQYLVRMAVVNHNGTGPFSDWIRADTPLQDKEEALLGAPRELRPQAGTDHIVLHWLPPADESIIVRGYQVGWGNNIPDVETFRVGEKVLQYKISGLKPSRDYVISLRAYNKQGVGFPIYETVRTSAFAAPEFAHDLDTSDAAAATPMAVKAETQSATSIRIEWLDADPNAFNTMYQVRYSTGVNGNQQTFVNSSENYHTVDGLRPATEYEFAVRAISGRGGASQWSMAVRNRTMTTAPSSAPRDVTVLPSATGDPHTVSVNWQPPKYANGDVEEYLIYYTDKTSVPDKDWMIKYVPGDSLSQTISNLLPKANYFFKVQARNEKGYGPFSQMQSFTPVGGRGPASGVLKPTQGGFDFATEMKRMMEQPIYLVLIAVGLILIILLLVLICVCVSKRSSAKRAGYVAGKKTSTQANDLWINNRGNNMTAAPSDYNMVEGGALVSADLKHLTNAEMVDSPPRYHALQESAYSSVSVNRPSLHQTYRNQSQQRAPLRQSVSSYEEELASGVSTAHRRPTARTKPMMNHSSTTSAYTFGGATTPSEDSQGTLSRSYHQSSTSLEGRQRTPQVVYTGGGRPLPIAKVDFNDSPYGSSSALASQTPPIPMQGPPNPPIVDGYRTLRGTPPGGPNNSLKSFIQLAGAPPNQQGGRTVVVAAGGRQLPVGRATAQPRVNVSSIYSPYSACSPDLDLDKKCQQSSDLEMQPTGSSSDCTIQPSHSTEDLNAQMENFDTMIEDLQAMQHDFGVA